MRALENHPNRLENYKQLPEHDPAKIHIAAVALDSIKRHGGYRRTAQLALMADASLTCVVPPLSRVPRWRAAKYILLGWFQTAAGLTYRGQFKAAFVIGYLIDTLSNARINPSRAHFLFEMCHGPNIHIGDWLARQGYKYIVAPHNIEFLVPHQTNNDCGSGAHFQLESNIYKKAHAALCISKADEFIVRCLGGTSLFLPYQPLIADLKRFEIIKATRANSISPYTLLYVGTAHNPPSKAGLAQLLNEFENSFDSEWTLHVAGYGTEQLANQSSSRIIIEGSVSDARLDELLCKTVAVLIHQPATTGFLTRLIEMSHCGIPTFANRSYLPAAGLQDFGIHVYDELAEVQDRIVQASNATHKPLSPNEVNPRLDNIWNLFTETADSKIPTN